MYIYNTSDTPMINASKNSNGVQKGDANTQMHNITTAQ